MNKLEFAQEMIKIARIVGELTFKNDFNPDGSEISRETGNYCTKWYLHNIVSRSYDAAKKSISDFIEESDIRYLGDNDLNMLKSILNVVLNK